jgi:hypothetical protein
MSGPDKIVLQPCAMYGWDHPDRVKYPVFPAEEYTRTATIPDPAAIARAALEAAAKRIAQIQVDGATSQYAEGYSDGVGDCFNAIRALANDPAALAEIVKGVKG